MESFVQKYGRNSILISLLLIALSLFLIFNPATSLNVIMIIIGIILTVNGIFHTVSYFSSPRELQFFSFELTEGIISLIIGIIFIFNPGIINTFLSIIIGSWIILQSITSIQLAFNMKNTTNHWIAFFIIPIATLLLGIVMLFTPFAADVLIIACGIILLFFEITSIVETATIIHYLK